ncbi:MAG: stage V sporulation protein AE [Clostridia bacterium]|nr:stage V sporulation protein AE [Clostridia bacterium]
MSRRRKVILVTDGDKMARKTVEVAARNIGARCISASAGNPTEISGERLVQLIQSTPHDPVVVMFDDVGMVGKGKGEKVLEYVSRHPEIEVIGAVAVASHTPYVEGVEVDVSIDRAGHLVEGPVNKEGQAESGRHKYLEGDTVDILNELHIPVIIGTGDTGKMDGKDSFFAGAPVTTKAFWEILKRSQKPDGSEPTDGRSK